MAEKMYVTILAYFFLQMLSQEFAMSQCSLLEDAQIAGISIEGYPIFQRTGKFCYGDHSWWNFYGRRDSINPGT
jgi:hypothetical protein